MSVPSEGEIVREPCPLKRGTRCTGQQTSAGPADTAGGSDLHPLDVDVAVTAPKNAGDQVTYTVGVSNDGNQTLSAVAVADPLCGLVLSSGDVNSNRLLDVGETWTYHCVYTVTQADIDAHFVRNSVAVQADDPRGAAVTGDDSAMVIAVAAPHMTLTKTPSTTTVVKAGDEIRYTVTLVNDGNVTLSNVSVADPLCLPAFVSGDGNGNGLLDVGESWTYQCAYAVTQADIDAGAVVNSATADAKTPFDSPVPRTSRCGRPHPSRRWPVPVTPSPTR